MSIQNYQPAAYTSTTAQPAKKAKNDFFDELDEIFSEAVSEIGNEMSNLFDDISDDLNKAGKKVAQSKPDGGADDANDGSEPDFFDDLHTIFNKVKSYSQPRQQELKVDDVYDNEAKGAGAGNDKADPNFFDDLDLFLRKILSHDDPNQNAADFFVAAADGAKDVLNTVSKTIDPIQELLSSIIDDLQHESDTTPSKKLLLNRKVVPANEIFAVCNALTKVNYELHASYIPTKGDTLTIKEQSIKSPQPIQQVVLQDELSNGGEGTVYSTNIGGQVAKIYKADKISSSNYEKLKLMCSKPIACEGICWPSAILYNDKNEFVGYLMPRAHGKELISCVFAPKKLANNFSNWKKADLVRLCITILEKINFLHDRNILMGDINPHNILIESPTSVHFVDTDSYQVEGFPCQVAFLDYLGPELLNKKEHFSSFLRTIGNENFTLAILLFQILMLGKHPYAIKDGDTTTANISKSEFAYIPSKHTQGRIPDGPWLNLWSHLSLEIKNDFYNTFNKDGTSHVEHMRMSSYDWLESCQNYLKLLESGLMEKQDPMSLEIMPTRCKKISASGKA